jgi:hypothetical protein
MIIIFEYFIIKINNIKLFTYIYIDINIMSETNNLKEYINKLIEIEKEEEKYKTLFSNLKKEKDTLNNLIINFMESNKITDKDIIFGDKKIKYTKTKIQDSITKKLIEDRLKIFLKSEQTAKEATNFIYSDRNSSQKTFLKIVDIKKD